MDVNKDPHNIEMSHTSLPQLFIINTTTGTERPFKGSVKELLEQYPEYKNSKTVLRAGAFGIRMYFYETGIKAPDS